MSRFISPITNIKANSTLNFFKSGTNSRLITYKDQFETIENVIDVEADSFGNLPNIFFSGSAKVVYRDEDGQQYASRDPIGGEKELGNFVLWDIVVTYDKNDIATGSDGKFYISLSNGNIGNDPTTDETKWEEWPPITRWNTNVTPVIGDVVQSSLGNLWKALTAAAGNDPETDDGTNWSVAINGQWINKSSAFTVFAGKSYQIDASGGAVDAPLKTAYVVGDEIIVHNESISTNLVRLTNTALTIKGPGGTVTSSDNLVLAAGDTAHLVAKTTTTLEAV